jgi:hypothetical protein
VSAEDAGRGVLTANRWGVGDWEKVGLAMRSDGKVALKSVIGDRYVTPSGSSLIASKTTIGVWEEFTVVKNSNLTTSLRAADGRMVATDASSTQTLTASRRGAGRQHSSTSSRPRSGWAWSP